MRVQAWNSLCPEEQRRSCSLTMCLRPTVLRVHDFTIRGMDYSLNVEEVYCAKKTPYQHLLIGKTETFGDALFLDWQIQSSETDEHIYHEALVHPAMAVSLAAGHPSRVLILGGGEGATLREALKHPCIESAVMVDIDRSVVEACRTHLPNFSAGSFENSRAEIVFQGALEYLVSSKNLFDVIVYDLTDPVPGGPAEGIFTDNFLVSLASRLTPEGVACFQMGSAGLHFHSGFRYGLKLLRERFATVIPYHTYMASFGLDWGFALATNVHLPVDVGRMVQDNIPSGITSAMSPESLSACFFLPPILKTSLGVI